jgi:hypothetical protein
MSFQPPLFLCINRRCFPCKHLGGLEMADRRRAYISSATASKSSRAAPDGWRKYNEVFKAGRGASSPHSLRPPGSNEGRGLRQARVLARILLPDEQAPLPRLGGEIRRRPQLRLRASLAASTSLVRLEIVSRSCWASTANKPTVRPEVSRLQRSERKPYTQDTYLNCVQSCLIFIFYPRRAWGPLHRSFNWPHATRKKTGRAIDAVF